MGVDSLLIVSPIVGFCNSSMFCCALLYVHSSFAIILMRKRELVALLGLSSLCLVIGMWLFLAVLWVCLQFMIVVFPDHTHLLFLPFLCHSLSILYSRYYVFWISASASYSVFISCFLFVCFESGTCIYWSFVCFAIALISLPLFV